MPRKTLTISNDGDLAIQTAPTSKFRFSNAMDNQHPTFRLPSLSRSGSWRLAWPTRMTVRR
jgi:hypothetical protein